MLAKELGEYCLPITIFLNFLVRLTAKQLLNNFLSLLFQSKSNGSEGTLPVLEKGSWFSPTWSRARLQIHDVS